MKNLVSSEVAPLSIRRKSLVFAAAVAFLTLGMPAHADVNRIKGNPNALILDGARVSDDIEMFYLSGQLPSPIDAKKPMTEVKSIDEMGDSKTQTISTLLKIKTLLETQGYKMSDLIKLSLFVAADPKTGKMDFAGVNEGFKQFFGTADNPNTVARSTFQVAALVGPYYLIEIEGIAAKKKASPISAAVLDQVNRLAAENRESDAEPAQPPANSMRTESKFKPATRTKRPLPS